jgi:hypothetical protein
MTHPNAALDGPAAAESLAQHRRGLRPAPLIAAALLSVLTIWIATPLAATAGPRSRRSAGSRRIVIDVIARTTSFRALTGDGFIATGDLFDKKTGHQVGTDVFYCLEVAPPAAGSQALGECPGTASFNGKGTLSVLGSFLVPPRPGESWTVAITGGTHHYQDARGELKVVQLRPTEEEGIWTVLS